MFVVISISKFIPHLTASLVFVRISWISFISCSTMFHCIKSFLHVNNHHFHFQVSYQSCYKMLLCISVKPCYLGGWILAADTWQCLVSKSGQSGLLLKTLHFRSDENSRSHSTKLFNIFSKLSNLLDPKKNQVSMISSDVPLGINLMIIKNL